MLTCSDLRLWGRDAWEVLTSGHRALHSKCRQQKPCCPAQEETRVEKIVTLVRNPYSCLSSIPGRDLAGSSWRCRSSQIMVAAAKAATGQL